MYSVTKKVEFCYGHRLLDHDGPCRHPHGHNARVEIEVSAAALDGQNMVVDFTTLKARIKGWIDRELDHRMILRRDDPLVDALNNLGEPMHLLDSNPTAERIARLIFDAARDMRLAVTRVTLWETSSSSATYSGEAS
jgi:6-pyruvoyltetrahydropterin/6-carboxytetrahydropterin synthase